MGKQLQPKSPAAPRAALRVQAVSAKMIQGTPGLCIVVAPFLSTKYLFVCFLAATMPTVSSLACSEQFRVMKYYSENQACKTPPNKQTSLHVIKRSLFQHLFCGVPTELIPTTRHATNYYFFNRGARACQKTSSRWQSFRGCRHRDKVTFAGIRLEFE